MTAPLRFVIAVDAAWTASIDGGGIANVAPRPLGALDQGQPWEEALDAVADRKMKGANDVKAFGKTLFDLLVGVDWWREILAAAARAQTSQFELALSWPPDRFALTRLPWELMHDGVDYVCGRPRLRRRDYASRRTGRRGKAASSHPAPSAAHALHHRDHLLRQGAPSGC